MNSKQMTSAAVVAIVLVAALAAAIVVVYADRGEQPSDSVEQITDRLLVFKTYSDYKFDDYLDTGSGDYLEFIDWLQNNVTNGAKIEPHIPLGCSTFTASTSSGDGAQWYHAKNMDLPIKSSTAVCYTYPANGYSSIAIGTPELVGYDNTKDDVASILANAAYNAIPYFCTEGVNEKGVSISTQFIDNGYGVATSTGKIDINEVAVVRLVLDHADSVEKAVELVQEYDETFISSMLDMSVHFFVSDASGNSAVLEWSKDQSLVVTYTNIVTNHYIMDAPDVVKEADSLERYGIIENALKENENPTIEEAMAILERCNMKHIDQSEFLIEWYTVYSVVFNNTYPGLDVCVMSDYSKTYHYDL